MSDGFLMQVVSIELPTPGIIVETQLKREIDSALQFDLTTIRLPTARPEVLSVPLARPPIKTHSFTFPQPVVLRAPTLVQSTAPNSESQIPIASLLASGLQPPVPGRSATRLNRRAISSSSKTACITSYSRRWKRCWPIHRSIFHSNRFLISLRAWRFSFLASERCSRTRWGWARRCRRSPRSACCSVPARRGACCSFARSRS